ncbi:MAG: hypothetical protein JW818_23520 [Pirellulales bacterium]|nr:hypothetical protein [Pirellulales bacterium]
MFLAKALFDRQTLELAFWLAVVFVLSIVAGRVITKIRAEPLQKEPGPAELLAKFSESHMRGELSDGEYREIKTTLAQRLQDELKGDGETG